MFLILKLLVIILLNESYAYFTQDTEIILLPVSNSTNVKEISLTLKAFGQLIQLNLRRNDLIVSPTFPVWKYNAKITKQFLQLNVSNPCYYYHEDDVSSATINFCDEHGLEGLLFLKNDALEIRPLRNSFAHLNLMDDICIKEHVNFSFGKPHLIKRSLQHFVNSTFLGNSGNLKQKRRHAQNTEQKLTVKLAVFFDKAAYNTFMPFLNNDTEKLRNVILVDACLQPKYNITPSSCAIVEFGATDGDVTAGFTSALIAAHEIGYLLGIGHDLDSIDSKTCPRGKYIMSDIKFYRGQATWSKCSRKYITEKWETDNCFDYMKSDDIENRSALDHYFDLPGREWTAKAQCELFLRDMDANVVTLHDTCQVLQCETPHKNNYFFAGPALDGTHCALGKECHGGECVPVIEPPYIFNYCEEIENNWSEWKEDSCKSSCLPKSKGVIIKRRSCKRQTYKTSNCDGPYYDVVLCNDSILCTRRKTINEYTTMQCTEFSLMIEGYTEDINYTVERLKYKPGKGSGGQFPHLIQKPWRACTVYCREKGDGFNYYSPHLDMLDLGIDPYFPDGTWCHDKDGQDYYCRQHYCLPENYSIEE
ncbi:A disintegrin and metalloproteinase with thrombospondin motifs 4-like isoform X2 [Linepithema humile]|uniref:A disintegrin and metalloproteinase with thrombospondin motifs 4-like isoform X2 n=1 Tax=Linepithema humile TaxID=83485 RepID=UPI00351F2B5E